MGRKAPPSGRAGKSRCIRPRASIREKIASALSAAGIHPALIEVHRHLRGFGKRTQSAWANSLSGGRRWRERRETSDFARLVVDSQTPRPIPPTTSLAPPD